MMTLTARVDEHDKAIFTAICASIGITTSAAVNMFVKAVVREHKIPFEVKRDLELKDEIIESMIEAKRIALDPTVKAYDVEEALEELKR